MSALAKIQEPEGGLCISIAPGPDTLWPEMKTRSEKKGGFTPPDLITATNADPAAVRNYIRRLIRAGYIYEAGRTTDRQRVYMVTRYVHAAPQLDTNGNPSKPHKRLENLWRAIKMLRRFSANELAAACRDDEITVNLAQAKRYVFALAHAGYLAPESNGAWGSSTVFRFLNANNTGPIPPRPYRGYHLVDWNIGGRILSGDLHLEEAAL